MICRTYLEFSLRALGSKNNLSAFDCNICIMWYLGKTNKNKTVSHRDNSIKFISSLSFNYTIDSTYISNEIKKKKERLCNLI